MSHGLVANTAGPAGRGNARSGWDKPAANGIALGSWRLGHPARPPPALSRDGLVWHFTPPANLRSTDLKLPAERVAYRFRNQSPGSPVVVASR